MCWVGMKFVFDLKKSEKNRADPARGKDFAEAQALWSIDCLTVSKNLNSGEVVEMRAGIYQGQIWAAMYVTRGNEIRILSFRRLNVRERRKYGFTQE